MTPPILARVAQLHGSSEDADSNTISTTTSWEYVSKSSSLSDLTRFGSAFLSPSPNNDNQNHLNSKQEVGGHTSSTSQNPLGRSLLPLGIVPLPTTHRYAHSSINGFHHLPHHGYRLTQKDLLQPSCSENAPAPTGGGSNSQNDSNPVMRSTSFNLDYGAAAAKRQSLKHRQTANANRPSRLSQSQFSSSGKPRQKGIVLVAENPESGQSDVYNVPFSSDIYSLPVDSILTASQNKDSKKPTSSSKNISSNDNCGSISQTNLNQRLKSETVTSNSAVAVVTPSPPRKNNLSRRTSCGSDIAANEHGTKGILNLSSHSRDLHSSKSTQPEQNQRQSFSPQADTPFPCKPPQRSSSLSVQQPPNEIPPIKCSKNTSEFHHIAPPPPLPSTSVKARESAAFGIPLITEYRPIPPERTTTEFKPIPPERTTTDFKPIPPERTTTATEFKPVPPQRTSTEFKPIPPERTSTEFKPVPPERTSTEFKPIPPERTTTEFKPVPPERTTTASTANHVTSTRTIVSPSGQTLNSSKLFTGIGARNGISDVTPANHSSVKKPRSRSVDPGSDLERGCPARTSIKRTVDAAYTSNINFDDNPGNKFSEESPSVLPSTESEHSLNSFHGNSSKEHGNTADRKHLPLGMGISLLNLFRRNKSGPSNGTGTPGLKHPSPLQLKSDSAENTGENLTNSHSQSQNGTNNNNGVNGAAININNNKEDTSYYFRELPPPPPGQHSDTSSDEHTPAASPMECRDFAASIEKVKDCGWYWGPLSSEAAEDLLKNEPDGSFIVRDSSDARYIFSLTFKLHGLVRHVRIEHDQGNFSFGPLTRFKVATIVDFVEKAVAHSRSGRYLFFLHRRPVLGPMQVQLLHPYSRFMHARSLKHMCRFVILKYVRRDLIHTLPLPKPMQDYLNTPHYYFEPPERGGGGNAAATTTTTSPNPSTSHQSNSRL